MITCFFGVPGAGKNTLLAKLAVKELRRMKRGKSTYEHVYSDFYVDGCERIDYAKLKEYKIYNSLILFQEMALDADNRKFKSFSDEIRDFFVLHRHLGNDIIYCTQNYDLVDLKIRALTQDLWYMSKSVVPILSHFTIAKRIYRCVNINEHSSELVLGYRFCNLIESFFVSNCKIVFRPFYYKYFDSFEEGSLENRPIYEGEFWNPSKEDKDIAILAQLLNLKDEFVTRIDEAFQKQEVRKEETFVNYSDKCAHCMCFMCVKRSECCKEVCTPIKEECPEFEVLT